MIDVITKSLTDQLSRREKKIVEIQSSVWEQYTLKKSSNISTNIAAILQTKVEQQLTDVYRQEKTLNRLSNIVKALKRLVQVLELLTIPTSPVSITVGLIIKIGSLLAKIKEWINILIALLNQLFLLLNIQKKTIKQIAIDIENGSGYNILDLKQFDTNTEVGGVDFLSDEVIFGEYTIVLKETGRLSNSIIRHVAIAYNRNGVEIDRTDESYASDPTVLIEQLKVKISIQ